MGLCILQELDKCGELFLVDLQHLCPHAQTHGLHVSNLRRRGLIESQRVDHSRLLVHRLTAAGRYYARHPPSVRA